MSGGTTAALAIHASQEVTHYNLKLRYVPLAFAARSETVALFFGPPQGFVNGGTCTKAAIGEVGAACSRDVKV